MRRYSGCFSAKRKHEREVTRFIKRHLSELECIPTAFLSVSLSEAGVQDPTAPAGRRAQAATDVKRMINTFLADTGSHPSKIQAVARDYEDTDWKGLDEFALDFMSTAVRL
jgi:menaquinone-dependent protoporphyrinogen IX oxidase